MGKTTFAPDQVTALPGAAAAAFAWRARVQLQVTVLVKATFVFAPDAEMRLSEPQEVLFADVYHRGQQGRVIHFASDWAPYLARADVVFTGHAHAPPGSAVVSMPVRITIYDGDRSLLDKALLVQDKAPFERMPIVYDRAPAGPDMQENPFGVAPQGPDAPNILDPIDPSRAAGFGPIARAWPARRRLLGDTPREALERPVQEIPDNFHWSYFQSAPRDQQIGYLRGGEWIGLHGLHPSHPKLRTRLPEARGVARVYGLSAFGVAEGQPLDLHADNLRIDGDEQRCTLVFRRSFPVPSEAALTPLHIVAGVELPGAPLAWPSPPTAPRRDVKSITLALPDDAPSAPPPRAAMPFQPGIAPVDIAKSAGPPPARLNTGTLALPAEEEDHSRAPEPSALPPPPPASSENPPPASAEKTTASVEEPLAPPAPLPPLEPPLEKKRPPGLRMVPAPSPALKEGLYKRFERK